MKKVRVNYYDGRIVESGIAEVSRGRASKIMLDDNKYFIMQNVPYHETKPELKQGVVVCWKCGWVK